MFFEGLYATLPPCGKRSRDWSGERPFDQGLVWTATLRFNTFTMLCDRMHYPELATNFCAGTRRYLVISTRLGHNATRACWRTANVSALPDSMTSRMICSSTAL